MISAKKPSSSALEQADGLPSHAALPAHSCSTEGEGTGREVINKNQPSLSSSCPERGGDVGLYAQP